MITFLISALVVIIGGVVLALAARVDPGYILLGYHGWTVESTLVVFVAALLVVFLVFYLLLRFLVNTGRMPRRLSQWRRQRRQARARKELINGMIALAEGRWERAESRLLKRIEYSDMPALNYLGAAKAAQKLGAYERGDDYLNRAYQYRAQSELAIGLTHAELQLNSNQVDQALSTLTHLRYLAPKHPYVLKLLMQLYYVLQDWERLLGLLPDLHKYKAAEFEELEKIEQTAHVELMAAAARNNDLHGLQQQWYRVPKDFKKQEPLLQEYARDLLICGANAEAELVVYQALRKQWHQPLVYLYGLIDEDATIQLARAESWLREHKQDPTLLLTLGRISIRDNLWGKGRSYLESSLALDPKPETYKELGDLLGQLGEKAAAMECYKQGLSLVATVTTAKPTAKLPRVIPAELMAQQHLLSAP
ncbi:MAG TPA: heme biosynthesis HemY N-terminal domain-containing protein [Gammaproteobacteria bacterium]|nr:heme biosynthesis HemY N-terminal domain-containing protein [Gammaproteobacteria bacterium]